MKISELNITTRFIVIAAISLVIIQILLIANSYSSEKKSFELTTRILSSEAFFRLKLNHYPVASLSRKLLKMNQNEVNSNSEMIEKELADAIADYKRFPSYVKTLLNQSGFNTDFKYSIGIRNYILYDSLTQKQILVKDNLINGKTISFGTLKDYSDLPVHNTFFMKDTNYMVEVAAYIQFENMFLFYTGKMKFIIIISLITTAMIFGSFLLALRTIREQKKLSEQKSDFINNITHEFNTPLNTIRVAGANLKNEVTKSNPGEVNRLAGIILRQNARLQKLVEDVLNASVFDDRPVPLSVTDVDVFELVTTIAEDLEISYSDKRINFIITGNKGILCRGDELHITTAIYNILENAAKYSPEMSTVEITISADSKYLTVAVKDEGPGIESIEQKHIFEKFYRSGSSKNKNVKGLGLGLYFVKKIIDAHSGRIEFESNPGSGSIFKLLFPVKNEKV